MKVLLDHNIPQPLRHLFPEWVQARTTVYMGWDTLTNGDLIEAAHKAAFDVFITLDRNIGFQHNLHTIPIGMLFIRTPDASFRGLRALMPEIIRVLPFAAEGRHLTVYR